nr:molecular chaperone DnaK [Bacillus sp. 165]
MTKTELETRLSKENIQKNTNKYDTEFGAELIEKLGSQYDNTVKRKIIIHHIKEDLKDVNRALLKMDMGVYGICEETGQSLPIQYLKIIPTARTVNELSYPRFKFL